MKSILWRSMAIAALALGLAACGGGGDDDEYVIKGHLYYPDGQTPGGVIYPNLALKNGSETINIAPGATEFEFPGRLGYGDTYLVEIAKQPDHQICKVVSPALDGIIGRDVAGRLTQIDVVVTCEVKRVNVIVSVPKPAAGAVLTNGSTGGSFALDKDTTTVSFPVQFGNSYGITILKQPNAGGPCTIENAAGTITSSDTNVTDVKLVCP